MFEKIRKKIRIDFSEKIKKYPFLGYFFAFRKVSLYSLGFFVLKNNTMTFLETLNTLDTNLLIWMR